MPAPSEATDLQAAAERARREATAAAAQAAGVVETGENSWGERDAELRAAAVELD